MISSSCWVPRGFALEFPEKYELDDAEMERINEMAKLELGANAADNLASEDDEEMAETEDKKNPTKALLLQAEIDDDLKEYDLENYDNEEAGGVSAFLPGLGEGQYMEDEDGAFLSLPTAQDQQEDKKEMQIYPTDNLVLATRTEDDVLYLDVYVYDDGAGAPDGVEEEGDKLDQDVANGMVRDLTLYVHHDLMLPAFPLCVEWVDYRPGNAENNVGNFAAIGTFDPQIELWNLDCVDKAFPDLILGEPLANSFAKLLKKKKKKTKGIVSTHHTDAVLSMTHNKTHRHVLASTSADTTVKLWDLAEGVAARSLDSLHHNKIVALSQWHAQEASILLTGGYDGACVVTDVRVSGSDMSKSFMASGEVENVRWGAQSELFYCGTDGGNVYCFDVRQPEKPLWNLHAHDGGISSLDVNKNVPGMLVTSAMNEKVIKLWRCTESGPLMVLLRDFGVGNVLLSSFAGDMEVAGHMAIGGVSGPLKMWDCFSNRAVRGSFKDELKGLQKQARELATKVGQASRIARKYKGGNDNTDTVLLAEAADDYGSDEDE